MSAAARTCARCRVEVEDRPLAWSLQVGPDGPQWLCEACTRRHLRAVEARLDDVWW